MANGAVEALAADREVLLEIGGNLRESEWQAESGCVGWSVKDVITHVGALFWAVVDPSVLPQASGLSTERAQDLYVEARRSWSTAQVLADYKSVSTEALDRLAGLEGEQFEVPLGDLGTYPASLLANAFSFDHYTHIRADLWAPRGPLVGSPPPSDRLRLAPALDWIEAALPQQNAALVTSLTGAVEIALSGPGARVLRLGPADPVVSISSDTASFVLWVTHRATWEELGVHAVGDEEHLKVARALRVF